MLFGVCLGVMLLVWPVVSPATIPESGTTVPFFKYLVVVFAPWLYVVFVTGVETGFSNAVNLTDGLDGLAAGLSMIAAAAFALFAYIVGRVDVTGYLNLFYLPGAGELAVFCAALMGGCLGFLWFNAHPAQVFMGDTGSLAIGGAFGTRGHPPQVGVPAGNHRRRVRGGGGVGDAADRGLPVVPPHPGPRVRRVPSRLPDGAAAPPLREARLGRIDGGGAVLDPGHLLRAGGARHPQAAMSRIDDWQAAGREVSVAGAGRSGTAAARLLAARGIPVYLSDLGHSAAAEQGGAALDRESAIVTVDIGHHDLERIGRSAALVLSPGIPHDAVVVRAARDAAVPVVAEVQVGLDALPGVPYVAVTGTNGKTTTTALVDHLLRAAGRRSVAAGNIGTALCEVALASEPPEWIALELSSFQLHDAPDVAPSVGVLTNLSPDHLDHYPTLEAYYADKARLFANATSGSVWVSNLDDPDSRRMVAGVPGRHLAFTTARDVRADAWYDRTTDQLMLAGQPLLRRRAFPLLGDHNVANALAAALAVHVTGVGPEDIARGLADFRGLPHRLEAVREVDGVLWINDSKATNVASTRVALQAMTRPFVLLLGGRHKGEPYEALIGPFLRQGIAVIAYGEAADEIDRDLSHALRVVRGGNFDDVVAKARVLAPAGGAVLLSPACSSYDMFENYEQRGATFRALVEAM